MIKMAPNLGLFLKETSIHIRNNLFVVIGVRLYLSFLFFYYSPNCGIFFIEKSFGTQYNFPGLDTLEALLDAATGHYTDAYDKITPFVGLHVFLHMI